MWKRSIALILSLAFIASLVTVAPTVAKRDREKKKAWLGVYLQDLTWDIKEALGLESKRGALVREVVKGSPADEAGLKQEDVIIKFDGNRVRNSSHLTRLIRSCSPGEKVKLTILREGEKKTISLTLGKRPKDLLSGELEFEPLEHKLKGIKPYIYSFSIFSGSRIGVKVQDLTEQLGDYFGVEDGEGALITEVEEDRPAFEAGLKAGDVIVEVDGEKIEDAEDLMEILSEKEGGDEVKLKVIRDGRPKTFEVQVEEEEPSSEFGDLYKLKILTEKLCPPRMFWEKEYSSGIEEEMENLKEQLDALKEELEELKEEIK